MALDIFKSKETELKLRDKFKLEGYNWEQVKQDLERVDEIKDIDQHLYDLDKKSGDYIDNYYKYLKGLVDKNNPKKSESFNADKLKEDGKKSADKWIKEKIKNIPIIGGFLETAFEWFNDKPKENDSFWSKLTKPLFASFGAGILGFFGGSIFEKYQKRIADLENILNPEQINEIKTKIKEITLKTIPGESGKIDKILDGMSYEKLLEYYNMINSKGGVSPKVLMEDFGSIGGFRESVEKNLKSLDKKAFNKISEFLFQTYGTKLDTENQNDLKLLISKYITNGSLSSEKLNEIFDKKGFKMKELYPLLGDGMMFSLELVGKGVINLSSMAWNFVGSSIEIVSIVIPGIGISGNIPTESLLEKLNNMNDAERASLIGLLYRKGGIVFSAMGNLSASIVRVGLDVVLPSNTGVDGLKLFKDGILKGPSAQFRNISRLEQAITGVADNIYITKVQDSIKMLEKNYKIMSIISNSKDIDGFKRQLSGKNANFLREYLGNDFDINKYKDLDEISKAASKKVGSGFVDDFEIKFEKGKNHLIKEKAFGFGKSSAMQKLNRAIENTVKHQQNVLDKGFGVFSKFRETLSVSKISHLSDKLVFEFESKKGAKTFLKQMNVMAQTSPELIKGIFNKLPIISVIGFSAASDKPFLEELQNEMLYLIPLVGPVMLFGDSGFHWDENGLHVDNPEKAILGGALIGLDTVFWGKDVLSGKGIKGKLFNFIKYPARPFIDAIDIGKGSAEFVQKLYKTTKTLKGSKDVLKQALERTKGLKGKTKLIGIAIIGLLGSNYAFADEGLEGYKDNNGNLNIEELRNDISEMTKEEKLNYIKLFFTDSVNKEMEFSLEGNILTIKSNTKEVKGDWFIDDDTRNKLYNLFGIVDINFK